AVRGAWPEDLAQSRPAGARGAPWPGCCFPASQEAAMLSWRTILCPVDFSEASRAAMHLAVDLARRLGGSVTLVHVYPLPVHPVHHLDIVAGPETVRAIDERVRRDLGRWCDEAAERAPGVQVVRVAVMGTPAEEILRQARQPGVDVIVMGTHG